MFYVEWQNGSTFSESQKFDTETEAREWAAEHLDEDTEFFVQSYDPFVAAYEK